MRLVKNMVGIIAEYNPFHNGHLYHLQKVKEMFPNETITLVLAGHFLNRGEVSVLSKWDKTQIALQYGIDLVVELPFVFASQAADIYAYGAISILKALKADYLVFGSECNDIKKLNKIAQEQTKENKQLGKYLKEGYSYPVAMAKAHKESINTPNDILAISYMKAIHKLHANIKPICIQRTTSYHNLDSNGDIASASAIRKALKEKKEITKLIPESVPPLLKNIHIEDYFSYVKHQIIIDDLTKYPIDDKLISTFKKNIIKASSLEEFMSLVKTKNFTYNHILRALTHILCGFTKEENKLELSYIRVLGFNEKGKEYLHSTKKEIPYPIYTTYQPCMALELKVTKVYSLLYGPSIIEDEFKHKPIIKK